MKFLLTFFILSLTTLAVAQERLDSLNTISDRIQVPDPIKTQWHRIDSVRNSFNLSADSLQTAYASALQKIDSETGKVQMAIDSLTQLRIPPTKAQSKLDSLNQKRQALEAEFNNKLAGLKSKTISKLDKIEMTSEMQQSVDKLTQQVNGIHLNTSGITNISPLEINGVGLPSTDGLSNLSEITQNPGLGDLPNVEAPLGDLKEVTRGLNAVGTDVKGVTEEFSNAGDVSKAIEQQATRIDGVQELQKQSGVIDEYQQQLDALNPHDVQQQGSDMAKEKAVNHFAGKEEQLNSAMARLAKIKHKYGSVKSLRDLPKRPPNAMKGKPFIERLVPGMFLQVQSKDAWLLDVNPYAGYKISGRLTSGIGWNQRMAYDRHSQVWVKQQRIYGPRAFVDAKLGRGFIAHLEQEVMNCFVPPVIKRPHSEPGKREWVWSTMLGIKRQYSIYKNLTGTVLVQYNLYNRYYKAPYLDRLNSRMGIEYTLKKKDK